ncbi:hypothetical protein BCV70DRAFT_199267 [Testicularia cyperi]|uniref:Uncharacterized protein n=1 Tax=Testicularia cyperi TaxID=1882483 RepID=A0A317XU54_9BASI|nr:hypothetical protein BCV70DRAFT_199267 [Testicularia cyperi]
MRSRRFFLSLTAVEGRLESLCGTVRGILTDDCISLRPFEVSTAFEETLLYPRACRPSQAQDLASTGRERCLANPSRRKATTASRKLGLRVPLSSARPVTPQARESRSSHGTRLNNNGNPVWSCLFVRCNLRHGVSLRRSIAPR